MNPKFGPQISPPCPVHLPPSRRHSGDAEESSTTARDLYRLVTRDRERVLSAKGSSLTAIRLLDLLPKRPIISIPGAVKLLDTTKPTAAKSIELLEKLGIVRETTGRKRDRTYQYAQYLERLRSEPELIRPAKQS